MRPQPSVPMVETRLNHALFGRAYVVHVNKDGNVSYDPYLDCTVSDSGICLNINEDMKRPVLVHFEAIVPLNVNVKKNASVHVVEQFSGTFNALAPAATFIHIEEKARGFFYRISEIEEGHVHHKRRAEIAKDGFLSTHFVNLSLGNFKEDIDIELLGPAASIDFFLLDLLCQSAHMNTELTITHRAEASESRQLVRAIYSDRAQGKFLGKVIVDKTAPKSSARQHYKTLVLGKDAKASVLPQLEINNYDITASHGATVGELDSQALFYLQSRGLSLIEAKTLLVSALSSEITNTISQSEISEFIENKVKSALSLGVHNG